MVLDCGHEESEHKPFTTGYGRNAEGKTFCYDCCAEQDKQYMRDNGKIMLYLTRVEGCPPNCPDKCSKHGQYYYQVSNWPGSLKIKTYNEHTGKHNMTGKRIDVWFRFEGQTWWGVQYGYDTDIIHCKRLKEKK